MKGFFGFTIVLAISLLLISLNTAIINQEQGLQKTKNELIIAEQANKERTLLENNVDKIIKTKLEEEINKNNFNVKLVQEQINSALEKYLEGKAKITNLSHEEKSETKKEKLNENSSVLILAAKGKTYSEYVYVSTLAKDTIVSAKLGNEIITYFEIPIGHTTRVIKLT